MEETNPNANPSEPQKTDEARKGSPKEELDLLIVRLIYHGLNKNDDKFREVAEKIAENRKQIRGRVSNLRADQIKELLEKHKPTYKTLTTLPFVPNKENKLLHEKIPTHKLEELLLSNEINRQCQELINEHAKAELLRTHNLEPRNKILLIGPPGNGKTSLAESIAEAMGLPFFSAKYANILGSYLGETSKNVVSIFSQAKTRPCVLFLDEFETLCSTRGNSKDITEMSRVVTTLLIEIDAVPSDTIFIAATNHDELLDHAARRRFQIHFTLQPPTEENIHYYLGMLEKRYNYDFHSERSDLIKSSIGKCFAEIEEQAISLIRHSILGQTKARLPKTSDNVLEFNYPILEEQLLNF